MLLNLHLPFEVEGGDHAYTHKEEYLVSSTPAITSLAVFTRTENCTPGISKAALLIEGSAHLIRNDRSLQPPQEPAPVPCRPSLILRPLPSAWLSVQRRRQRECRDELWQEVRVRSDGSVS